METQLFFCEFKGYIATAFDIAQIGLDHCDLDCLFDIYEAYLDSNTSVFHFVNSNFNTINARLNFLENDENGRNMENIEIVELTYEQKNTIDQAFKTEHLKDELAIDQMFDYDFNFDDE